MNLRQQWQMFKLWFGWKLKLLCLKPGLYLLTCPARPDKGLPLTHYAILDIGNQLDLELTGWLERPILVHQTPPEIQHSSFSGVLLMQNWILKGKINDPKGARDRLLEALQDRDYHLVFNNCEHFARHVCFGTRESTQVQLATCVTAVTFGLLLLGFFTKRR